MRISDWSSDVCSSDLIALVVGCATGYDVAVLAKLANTVIGLDADAALVAQAGQTLQQLGIDNTALIEGPLAAGLAKQGPFNVILIAGAVPEIPPALLEQLADGGRLVGVVRGADAPIGQAVRSEEHTSELQSLMRISYAVFCLKKK